MASLLPVVRLNSIEFEDFRNIGYGKVTFPNTDVDKLKSDEGSILGLYGQNGSGKTSVIIAINLLKCVLNGGSLDDTFQSCVMSGKDICHLSYEFTIIEPTNFASMELFEGVDVPDMLFYREFVVTYSFNIEKRNKNNKETLHIINETIQYSVAMDVDGDVKKMSKQLLMDTSTSLDESQAKAFGNKAKYNILTNKSSSIKSKLVQLRAISDAMCKSFIFNTDVMELLWDSCLGKVMESELLVREEVVKLQEQKHESDDSYFNSSQIKENDTRTAYLSIVSNLKIYGTNGLFIVNTSQNGMNIDNGTMPIYLWISEAETGSSVNDEEWIVAQRNGMVQEDLYKIGDFKKLTINVNECTKVPVFIYKFLRKRLEALSNAINAVVPDLKLEIVEKGVSTSEKGYDEQSFEIWSRRNEHFIPLKYESDGIRKIIAVLYPLIQAYNNPSCTVAIDEIDSGIFEYMLGEILTVMQESAKGQLLFTSHNLRPLEVLDAKNLCFTTTNSGKRFTKFSKRGNSNMRDGYYRNIILGTSEESIYNPTDRYDIEMAFMEVGGQYE